MGFKFQRQGIAASVFLALYTIYFEVAANIIWQKKTFNSFYSCLLAFGLIRLGSQVCGIAFATLGYEHLNWLIAHLVLGAVEYFLLILASFLVVSHAHKEAIGRSYLTKAWFLIPLGCFKLDVDGLLLIHIGGILANFLVISGASTLAGLTPEQYLFDTSTVDISNGLRITGQIILLAFNILAGLFALHSIIYLKIRSYFVFSVLLATPIPFG
ncbi:BA75_01656T0 [Komagataella pastoris]|uniref:BA75_01656T0 n=1 Tax=Komagataella pastoris TaxID=4922 RepID=A0A1B2J972_PICPA|nr:BA75_01656T0 [Komagataella pastoris]